ncbi:ras-related protein RABH1b [Tripterygium wilfordii]|uniref:Ras-related protein RABH1b n=1 Tax=Tripterygium wilfordii TaxID=458696 RepID=A0A7J7CBT8_TRIWF|nr:ras-related protein RABH1b [Tripterygium wilfordii]
MAPVSALAKYKLVFLGDQSVGKTSIITRFMYDKFDNTYQIHVVSSLVVVIRIFFVIRVDFGLPRAFEMSEPSFSCDFDILIAFPCVEYYVTSLCLRMPEYNHIQTLAYASVLKLDSRSAATEIKPSRQSFLNTSKWIEEVRTERGSDVIIVLVGNKTDLVDKRQVSIEEGEAKARELNVMFIETSAKAGFNIKVNCSMFFF